MYLAIAEDGLLAMLSIQRNRNREVAPEFTVPMIAAPGKSTPQGRRLKIAFFLDPGERLLLWFQETTKASYHLGL